MGSGVSCLRPNICQEDDKVARRKKKKEFPTPYLLAEAQSLFSSTIGPVPKGSEPFPTTSSKESVFRLEDYETIDANAGGTPDEACFDSLQNLVVHLSSLAQTDLGRVRAIFRWILAQDINHKEFRDKHPPTTAAYYLARIKTDLGGYNDLFKEMCSLANIRCEKISGDIKVAGHEPGKGLEVRSGMWCAVYLREIWRFVDVSQSFINAPESDIGEEGPYQDGMACKTQTETVAEPELAKYNNFYFLTDPQEFIYSHKPHEEAWQLLARPVTREEFRDMALLEPSFFDLGFDIDSHPRSALRIAASTCSITLKLPKSGGRRFMCRLYRLDESQNASFTAITSLERYVFLEVLKDKSVVRARVNCPTTGEFKLELYSRDTTTGMRTFKRICVYTIENENSSDPSPQPFPPNPRGEWGPGADIEETGITPISHKAGVVEAGNEDVELRFRLGRKMDLLHTFFRDDAEEAKYKNYVFHRFKNDEVIIRVRTPEDGMYALNLYAKDSREHGTFSSICTYMIQGKNISNTSIPFPEMPNGCVGPQGSFDELGLSISDSARYFQKVKRNERLTLSSIKISAPLEFNQQINFKTPEGERDVRDFCTHETKENTITYSLVLPETGMCSFLFYGKRPDIKEHPLQPSLPDGEPESDMTKTFPHSTPCLIPPHCQPCCSWIVEVVRGELEVYIKREELIRKSSKIIAKAREQKIIATARERKIIAKARERKRKEDRRRDKDAVLSAGEGTSSESSHQQEEGDQDTQGRIRDAGTQTISEEGYDLGDGENGSNGEAGMEEKDSAAARLDGELEEQIAQATLQADKKEKMQKLANEQRNEIARERLRVTMTRKDPRRLEAAICNFKARGLQQNGVELEEAEKLLDSLSLRDKLSSATAANNGGEMNAIVREIEEKGYPVELQHDLGQAKNKILHKKREERRAYSRFGNVGLFAKQMTELRRYSNPPNVVHRVIIATLLLLGKHEGLTKKWRKCQSYCIPIGRDGLETPVLDFDVNEVHPEIAARAGEIICNSKVEEVRKKSAGAVTFYIWCEGVVEDVRQRTADDWDTVKPANKARQKEIFNKQPMDIGRKSKSPRKI